MQKSLGCSCTQRLQTIACQLACNASDERSTAQFSDQYYFGSLEILTRLRRDATTFGDVAELCASAIGAGGRVFANLVMGHMPAAECADSRSGNPCVFIFNSHDYSSMRRGDVLLTHAVTRDVGDARRRGVKVIAFTCPYVNHSAWPSGEIQPSEDDLMLEDVADLVVNSHIPWEQGLVQVPGRPEFPAFPSSSTATCAIFWMLSAEVVERLALVDNGCSGPSVPRAPGGAAAKLYVEHVLARLKTLRARLDNGSGSRLSNAGRAIARRVLRGGRLLVRGAGDILPSETHWVASGMWLPDWYDREHQRPDPHCSATYGSGGDYLPGPAPLRAAEDGGCFDTTLIATVCDASEYDQQHASLGREHGHLVVAIGPPAAEAALRHAGCAQFLSIGAVEGGVLHARSSETPPTHTPPPPLASPTRWTAAGA